MYIKVINSRIISIVAFSIIILFTIGVIANNRQINSVLTNGSVQELSNKKIGWGIKRAKNHAQPDVGTENKALIDEYKGLCLGNAEQKYIYLTFDNGYEAGYTNQILDVLKANEVPATFFITGHYLNSQEDIVKRIIEDGHIVGNHTINHKSMPDVSDEKLKTEIMNLHTAVYNKTGYEMKYIRPPMGEYSQRTLSLSNSLGYTTVMWSMAYDDWDENKQKGDDYAKQKIIDNIHPGAIILLHATSKDNANVLDYCIKEIENMGYEFKSLDQFEY